MTVIPFLFGAGEMNRTPDLLITEFGGESIPSHLRTVSFGWTIRRERGSIAKTLCGFNMPEISRFFGIVIYMNWREHPPIDWQLILPKKPLNPIDPLE